MAMAMAMVTDALKNSQYFGVNGTGTGDAALKISHYFFLLRVWACSCCDRTEKRGSLHRI